MLLQVNPLGYRFFTLYPSLYLSLYPTTETKKEPLSSFVG